MPLQRALRAVPRRPTISSVEHNDMTKTQIDRIGELEAELKQRDARIMQLTKERDQERKLNDEWREGSNRWQDAVEAWKQRSSR
jgi:hypothetical protein